MMLWCASSLVRVTVGSFQEDGRLTSLLHRQLLRGCQPSPHNIPALTLAYEDVAKLQTHATERRASLDTLLDERLLVLDKQVGSSDWVAV